MDWLKLWRKAAEPTPPEEEATDARRAGGRRHGEPDPDDERRRRNRRRAALFAFASVFVAGSMTALLGQGGLLDLTRLWGEQSELRRQVTEQRQRVEALRHEARQLENSPMARERIAREQLGYSSPGEVTFLLPEADDVTP